MEQEDNEERVSDEASMNDMDENNWEKQCEEEEENSSNLESIEKEEAVTNPISSETNMERIDSQGTDTNEENMSNAVSQTTNALSDREENVLPNEAASGEDPSSTASSTWILNPYLTSSQDIWCHLKEKLGWSKEENKPLKPSLSDEQKSMEKETSSTVMEDNTSSIKDVELPDMIDEEDQQWQHSEQPTIDEEYPTDNIDKANNLVIERDDRNRNKVVAETRQHNEWNGMNEEETGQDTVRFWEEQKEETVVTENESESSRHEDMLVDNRQSVPTVFPVKEEGECPFHAEYLWLQLLYRVAQDATVLAERLQMILEPSVASQLVGNYRTGKRLHMKKVIEFYASDFKKDHIWLRRVQPDRRQYDILIAIDDSASMLESQASFLAIQTLALLASSFTRYEIGRLAVAKFGSEVDVLRSFDDSSSIESQGANILQQFRFRQSATDMKQLLRQSISLLTDARTATSASSMATVQLLFIISDGRLQEREALRKLVREAWERRQLIVFLLIDYVKDDSQRSVLDLKRVETLDNGELRIRSYLDDFPFPFYILVRHVESLPHIVASALQQWTEMVNPSHLSGHEFFP
eukprot:jgi/Galph1/2496/GphlegSOOS_G1160.1